MTKVLLKYHFIFDSIDTWPRVDNFNSDLNSLFKAKGFRATIVDRQVPDDLSEEVTLFIEKVEEVSPVPEPKQDNLQPELREALE